MVTLTPPVETDDLPAGPLLAARLVVLFPLWPGFLGLARPNPDVAAFAWLDWTEQVPGIVWLIGAALYLGCAVALWLAIMPRAAAAVAGSIILVGPLVDLGAYANNRILAGLVLVLLGLYEPRTHLWPLRIQLSVMYGAAALNKVFDPDWRDGTFIEHWTDDLLDLRIHGAVRDLWSGIDRLVGWSAFVIEATLAVLFLLPGRIRWAVAAALAFHGGMLVFTEGEISWLFAYVVGATLVAFSLPRSIWPPVAALLTLRVAELVIS
ncbi:MAG: hypothetical protein AAF081_00530 [Actinomycetota bacterium]